MILFWGLVFHMTLKTGSNLREHNVGKGLISALEQKNVICLIFT